MDSERAPGYFRWQCRWLIDGSSGHMRPDLFKVAIADVPFVDIVTTILDTSLPLSYRVGRGNPNDKNYDYMKSHSLR